MLMFLKTEKVFEESFTTIISGMPSPSKSPLAVQEGPLPAIKSFFVAKELVVKPMPALVKVTIKGLLATAVSPLVVTEIG